MRPSFFKTWLAFCLILPVTAHALDREQRLPMGPPDIKEQLQANVAATPPTSTTEASDAPAVPTPEPRRSKPKTAKADSKPAGKGKAVAKVDKKHPAKPKSLAKTDAKPKTVAKASAKPAQADVAENDETPAQAPVKNDKHASKTTQAAAKTKVTGKKGVKGATVLASNKQSSKVVNRAVKALGTPYRWGGTSPTNGFDCSGFVKYAFNDVKAVSLPHNSGAMAAGRGQKVSKGDLKPGDLLFFNTEGRKVDHVAIYLGNDKFIHAPREGKNVSIDNLKTPYWQNHYVLAKRVLPKDKSMVVQR